MGFNYSRAQEIHGNRFDYSEVHYKNSDTKVRIICHIHGLFQQTPYKHVNMQQGCPKCKGERIRSSKCFNLSQFITNSNRVHNNRYIYPIQDIKNAHHKVKIICRIHGEFLQNFNNHIYNQCGCPSCGRNVSKLETEWLDSLNIPQSFRQKNLQIKKQRFKVDALDSRNNTVYEFFGFFWHGHPDHFNPDDINPRNKTKFGILYRNTLEKIQIIKDEGYHVIEKWG
jgi:Zn finger protein HypA/HybF involved in hydrogenase expression